MITYNIYIYFHVTTDWSSEMYISAVLDLSLQSLHAVDVLTYVQFLPTLLNQLFSLLVKTVSDDVALNVVKWALP